MTRPAADEPSARSTATPVPEGATFPADSEVPARGVHPQDDVTPADDRAGADDDLPAADGAGADAPDLLDGAEPAEPSAVPARPDHVGATASSTPPDAPADEAAASSVAGPLPADDPALEDPAPDVGRHDDPAPGGAGDAAPPVVTVDDARRPGAWATLGRAMRPSASRGQLLAAALCALLGFALVVQLRQSDESQLGSLRQNDLVRLLDETTTRADELSREAAELERERDDLVSGTDSQQAALDAARRGATTQGILTGRLPAVGPGVRITLTETSGPIRPVTMLHVLEELRNAGAEAIQINDTRVVASSAFTGVAGEVVLDGALLEPPYRWLVIGDPDTMATALEIPGGAIAAVRLDGGSGSVEQLEDVEVDAVVDVPEPQYATPVPVERS